MHTQTNTHANACTIVTYNVCFLGWRLGPCQPDDSTNKLVTTVALKVTIPKTAPAVLTGTVKVVGMIKNRPWIMNSRPALTYSFGTTRQIQLSPVPLTRKIPVHIWTKIVLLANHFYQSLRYRRRKIGRAAKRSGKEEEELQFTNTSYKHLVVKCPK